MPIEKYDRFFGGKPGSAQKAKSAMEKEYGPDKGDSVFYATKNRNKNAGNPTRGRERLRAARKIAGY